MANFSMLWRFEILQNETDTKRTRLIDVIGKRDEAECLFDRFFAMMMMMMMTDTLDEKSDDESLFSFWMKMKFESHVIEDNDACSQATIYIVCVQDVAIG
jgi:hypothetical protein